MGRRMERVNGNEVLYLCCKTKFAVTGSDPDGARETERRRWP